MQMIKDKIQINGQHFKPKDIHEKLKDQTLPDWEKGIYEFILNWFDESDFILQQTSGSTGTPKEIKLKKSAMISSANKTIHFFNLNDNDTAWLCLPIDYIAGKMMVVRALLGRLNLIISEPEGAPKLPAQTIDFTAMVPLQVQKLLESKTSFLPIHKLIIGGAASNNSLLENIQQLPTEVYATYGMTETCSHIALQRLNGPTPDKQFKILDGISISQNDENCLVIHSPELSDKPIETTDLVELVSPSEFKILGRIDNIINTGGLKISPEKLESEISKIIGKECLIVSQNDPLLGQKMVLVLEGKPDNNLSKKILAQIKSIIGKHRSPKTVYLIDKFPRNNALKIDRKKVIKQLNVNQ